MKRLDALVLKELIGPWIFGVSMFSMLLVAATYLGRIARYVVEGVPSAVVLKITILLLPAILVKTFAMALLLGALLAFGRLSGDSEITAIRAAGVSLYRIILPVATFALLVAGLAFYLNEQMVPRAARESQTIMLDIAQKGGLGKGGQPIEHHMVQNGRVVAMYGALNFSAADRTMQGVHVIAYDKEGHELWVLFAKELDYTDLQRWRVIGDAEILSLWNPATGNRDAQTHIKIAGAWPEQIPQLDAKPEDILAAQSNDTDIWSMSQIRHQIEEGTRKGTLTPEQARNLEYGYWNKIALPLAAFIFGTLGATLGIRNHRTGTATGFAIAIAIIFSYFTLANFMNVYAMGGVFPPYVASFTPIAIGLVASGVIIWRRNR